MVPLRNGVRGARVLGEAAVPAKRSDAGIVVDLRSAHGHAHATVVALDLVGKPQEDTRFLPDGDGVITLPVTTGTIQGDKIKLESHVDRHASATIRNLGHWNTAGEGMTWDDVAVDTSVNPLMIELELALAPGSEGGVLEYKIAGRTGTYEVSTDTGGWQKYQRIAIGSFTSHAGMSKFEISAKSVRGQGVCNLRTVRLIPDKAGVIVGEAMFAASAAQQLEPTIEAMQAELEAGRHAEVAAVYADDARILGPGAGAVVGREAIDAYWKDIGKAKRWELDIRSTEGAQGLVVQRGRSTLVVRDQRGDRTSVVDFVLTWRLMPDGGWRIQSDVYWPVR